MFDERPTPVLSGSPIAEGLPMKATDMSLEPIQPPVFPVTASPAAPAAPRAAAPLDTDHTHKTATDAVREDKPSNEALAAVQVAAQAYEELRRAGRELRFKTSEEGVLKIEVYDGTGELVRSIPPNEALALASGEAQRWA